jgi:hypothetical protein
MGDPVIDTFLLNLALASESMDVVAAVAEYRTLELELRHALNESAGKETVDWKSRMDARFRLATSKVDLLVKRCDTSREKYIGIMGMLKGDRRLAALAIVGETLECCEELRNAMARARAECIDIKTRTDALIESAMQSAK